MSISNRMIPLAEKAKPVLVKILPVRFLRKWRDAMLNRKTRRLKKVKRKPYAPEQYAPGVNLIGNIRGDNGIGESTRIVAGMLTASEYDFNLYNFFIPPGVSMTNHAWDEKINQKLDRGINLIHINPSEFTLSYIKLGKKVWDGHYNIAYWLWELEEFPQEWLGCLYLVDEIWTPSEFISKTLRKLTPKPVVTVPYYIEAHAEKEMNRAYFGLPEDCFLYLMMFDSGSLMERKNPLGAIESFKSAFSGEDKNVGLVIKTNGLTPEDKALLKRELTGYENIYLVSRLLSRAEVNSLIHCVDVYVSLHRAEGFGLVLAEAMALGTPVIATNWSANTEFTNSDVACMVDYEMVALEKELPPYKKGWHWAQPDTRQAAEYMRRLRKDKSFYNGLKERAAAFIAQKLNAAQSAKIINERLKEIEERCR